MPAIDQSLPILYHGTSAARAASIRRAGFRRAKNASYTGTAVNLTEAVCTAWEYGPDRGGRILEVTLAPETRWENVGMEAGSDCDARFAAGQVDALRTFGGNIWLLWNPKAVVSVRAMTTKEIMVKAAAEWRADGYMGYNGDMGEMAELYWKGEGAVRKSLGIVAPADFDKNAWKENTVARYKRLLALAGVSPGDGSAILNPE